MADATRLSVMSKQIEDNKQATDDLKAQMADLSKSQSHIEAMLSKLVSPSSGQTSRASGRNASPSGSLTNSMMTPLLPEPPDPPDFNQFGQRLSKLEIPVFDGTLLDCWIAKVDRFFELEQCGNEEKLNLISLSVEGAALKWFRRHRREFTDWTDMKRKLMARFRPTYKPDFPTVTNMEQSPRKLCCEEIQESGMTGLCVSSDGSYHLESKKSQNFVMECEDATMSGGETNVETKPLLEKETIPSSVLCDQVPATQSQDNDMIQQEELVHDTETIREMGPIQEPEPLELVDSIFEVDFVHSQEFPSQCQTIGSICDSELGQDNSHDEEKLIGLNLGKLLKNERLFSIICLLGLNDMSFWTQLLRQQIFPKSWRFKFKTESSGEAILLKKHDDSVETNLVKFERALSRLSLPVAHALNIFLTNMSFHLASHVRQFDVTTIADAVWVAKRCESSLLQYSSATQSRAPFSPYQSYNDQPYYEKKFGECPEIEFDRESDEIKDVKLQDKQPKEDVKTLVMSENEQSLESVDDESFNDEKSGEIIAEGTAIELVDKSGYKVFREGNLNSLLLQEFHIVLLHFKESSDTIVPCRNRDTRVLSSHFFAGGVKLLSKMVCAFLLPFLTMNIDSRTICLNSRSIFVDDDTVALRRIVEDRFVPRMEEIYLESTKQNLEFATDRGWVELWINTQDFTLTNYGLRLSPSEYTKNTFLLVYHLSKHSVSCLFLNTSTGCIGALLMIYYAKMLIQLDAPTVFNDLLCKMRIVHGLEDLRQFTRVGIKFHLKHKWRSKFGSNKLTRTWTSYSRYDSSSCVLRQEKNYVMALFPIGEALTLVNDQHTLVAQKKGTETSTGCCYGFHADLDLMADVTAGTADIPMDEFSSVCKLMFGVFVLNLMADQVRDWSFFGLLLQWKWHPPPQATSEFHQAHNDKPVFHL